MDETLRQFIRHRSGGICEYCQFAEENSFDPFQVDHIIAEKHRGPSVESNLAWSCFYCNTYKGPNVAGWIAETGAIVRLYHPRKDTWSDHFQWNGPMLVNRSDVGSVTIDVLRMNHPDALAVRRVLLDL